MTRELLCDGCNYASQETQRQSVLHVEPHAIAEASIQASLGVADLAHFTCDSCGSKKARQQTRLGDLPQFLMVHFNKQTNEAGPMTAASVRVYGTNMQRVADTHHIGHTPESGHYNATVATSTSGTYLCDDVVIKDQFNLAAQPWHNSYLIFLRRDGCGDLPHAAKGEDPNGEELRDDIDQIDVSCDDPDESNDGCGEAHLAAEDIRGEAECPMQATECRVTSSRHDDWLHRGPFLLT